MKENYPRAGGVRKKNANADTHDDGEDHQRINTPTKTKEKKRETRCKFCDVVGHSTFICRRLRNLKRASKHGNSNPGGGKRKLGGHPGNPNQSKAKKEKIRVDEPMEIGSINKINCWICSEEGHISRDCKERAQQRQPDKCLEHTGDWARIRE